MTLVLSVLTHREVVQVSDRRFAYLGRDRSIAWTDDEKNKAVLFCGRLAFSFTGFGDLGPDRRTDLWLAKGLAGWVAEAERSEERQDQRHLIEALADRATALFRKLRYRDHRHAFVAVGWARFSSAPEDFRPYLACISNFHDAEGNELDSVRETFGLWIRALGEDEGGFLWPAGQRLEPGVREALLAEVSEADRQRSPQLLVEALGESVRAIAGRNEYVGKGLMINVLPRTSLRGDGHMAVAGPPVSDTQTFLYVPPTGRNAVQLGPVATCGGMVLSDFRASPSPKSTVASSRREPGTSVRRFYLAPIIGTGTEEDPYRAHVHGHNHSAVVPSDEQGHPLHRVALVIVSADDHAQLEDDPSIVPVADLADFDIPVEELPNDRKAKLEAAATRHGLEFTGLVREVVRRLGQVLQPDFHEDNLWVQ
jgi:hypothetical protein